MRRAPERLAALAGANFAAAIGASAATTPMPSNIRLIKVEAERAGRERLGRQPAQQHEVGRRHRVDHDIGENYGPAERKRRAEFAPERTACGCSLPLRDRGDGGHDRFWS